ncbi:type VII secretion protein EccE [Nocardia sp. NPDC003979]
MNSTQIPESAESPTNTHRSARGRHRTIFDYAPLYTVLPCTGAGAAAATSVIAGGGPIGYALGAGVAVAAGGAVRVNESNLWRTLGARGGLWLRNRGDRAAALAELFDTPISGASPTPCGMRWDGRHLTTMLAMDRTAVRPTLLRVDGVADGPAVALSEVAACLRHFDIRLAAIDVVTFATRAPGPPRVVDLYRRLLGSLPHPVDRPVWLVLRFDPLMNTAAIDIRGGGETGIARAALIATRRVASVLTTRDVRVRILTARERAAVDATLLHDTEPSAWTEHWTCMRNNGIHLTATALPATGLTPAALTTASTLAATAVTTRLRLTPAPSRSALDTPSTDVALTALIRHDSTGVDTADLADLGVRPVPGRQRRLLFDAGSLGPEHELIGPATALAEFTVTVGGGGQVVGATEEGAAVVVPLFGPTVRRVEIAGSLRLAQLLVLRAVADGAAVLIHTVRPEAWAHLVDSVDMPAVLALSSGGVANAAVASMVIYDGVTSAGQVSEATVVYLREHAEAAVRDADVAISESATREGALTVRTRGGGELVVRLVSIPAESEYLAPPPAPGPAEEPQQD